jgi:hypothetical protein
MRKQLFAILLVFLPMLMITSCDPTTCSYSKVINQTAHRVTLKLYCQKGSDGSFDEKIFHIAPMGTTVSVETCVLGDVPWSFSFLAVKYFNSDSLDLIFNDSLNLRYYKQCCICVVRNPLDDGCFEPVPGETNTYAYRITEADYQQALEQHFSK